MDQEEEEDRPASDGWRRDSCGIFHLAVEALANDSACIEGILDYSRLEGSSKRGGVGWQCCLALIFLFSTGKGQPENGRYFSAQRQ